MSAQRKSWITFSVHAKHRDLSAACTAESRRRGPVQGLGASLTNLCNKKNPNRSPPSEWTLNLVEVPPVIMACFVIYLMDGCNCKDDAVHHFQQSNGYRLFDKGYLHDVKIQKFCASCCSRGSEMYEVDFPKGVAVCAFGCFLTVMGRSYKYIV